MSSYVNPIHDPKSFEAIYPPRSLTRNLKISPWKRRFHWETIIFRFHVKLQGCRLTYRPSFFEILKLHQFFFKMLMAVDIHLIPFFGKFISSEDELMILVFFCELFKDWCFLSILSIAVLKSECDFKYHHLIFIPN